MLPSMPLLFSSSRDSLTGGGNKQEVLTALPKELESDCNGKDKKEQVKMCISNEIPDFTFESLPEDEKECDDELVLMAENSPFGEKRKLHAQTTATRKKRRVDPVETLLEDRNSNDDQANHFAMAYFMKAKGELDELTFQKFIALLSELDDETLNAVSLYNEMRKLLSGYPELAEEFIGFLHPYQAVEADKLTDFLNFEQSWNFFRKLDAFHLNKVNHLLEQHSLNPDVTNEGVRASLLGAFKGHPTIAEGLLGLMPDGKPVKSCKEDYEDISELSSEDSSWERLSFTDSMSRACIPGECDCCCHSSPTKKFCTYCNVKFSKGQIYVQTGKGLRFAKVTFRGCDQEEVLWRLHPTFYNKPISRKRTKSSSHQNKEIFGADQVQKRDTTTAGISKIPEKAVTMLGKDGVDVEKMEEEEEILYLESQLKNDINSEAEMICSESLVLELPNSDKLEDVQFDPGDKSVVTPTKSGEMDGNSSQQVSDLNDGSSEETYLTNNSTETENRICTEATIKNGSINIVADEPAELALKEDDQSSKEYVDLCKKERLEPPVDEPLHKSFIIEVKNENTEETKVWTREEDKLILQAFQHQHGNEQTFSEISNLLPSRSIEDIQGRFQVLMNLLEQMTNGCYESNTS